MKLAISSFQLIRAVALIAVDKGRCAQQVVIRIADMAGVPYSASTIGLVQMQRLDFVRGRIVDVKRIGAGKGSKRSPFLDDFRQV